jgi:hypothetical protein
MATAELHPREHAATGDTGTVAHTGGSLAEWVFVASGMAGAVWGALTGVGVSRLAFPADEPLILGTLGTVFGSLLCAVGCGLCLRHGRA